ncbi:MAG TPA: recombinase RecA [Polyangiales bacterium]|nr:recombinase RecA [Polyangiales bacterium]
MSETNRGKALELAVASIEKAYGKGAIMRLGEQDVVKAEVTSSGAISLDLALGVGGFPKGRIIEIYGPESSGKTTLTLHAIAECQKAGGVAAFIDAEHALDVGYARKLGVNIEELLVAQPDYGEQALEIADTLVRSGAVDFIVVDSVAALVPKAEIEGEMGDSHVGLQARLMSQALRKLTGNVHRSNVTLFFINQIRMKIGVMFGSPETTTGGNALKFYSSMRLDIRRVGAIKVGDQSVGNRTRVKVVKNKLAPPFTECEFDVLYGEGISKSGDLLDLAVNDGILEKSGAWFSYGGERVGQGRENARNYLQEHPKLLAEIETRVLQKHGLVRTGKAAEAAAAAAAAPAPASGLKALATAANSDAPKGNAETKANAESKAAEKNGADKSANDKNAANAKSAAASEAAAAASRPRPRA